MAPLSAHTTAGYLLADPGAPPADPGDRATALLANDYAGARALLLRRFEGTPYGPEDLLQARAPLLVPIDEQPHRHGAGPCAHGSDGPARGPQSPPTPIRFADWFWE